MAKMMTIVGILIVFTASFWSPARALLAHRWRCGDLWDAIVDPLKVLDQLPQFISKGVEDHTLIGTNWKETPEAHVFILDAPGVKKEEIKIEVDKSRVITISVERGKKDEKKGYKWYRVKRGGGKFWRQFRLPGNVDMDKIKADLDSGVLTVTVPKISCYKTKNPKVVEIVKTGDVVVVEL